MSLMVASLILVKTGKLTCLETRKLQVTCFKKAPNTEIRLLLLTASSQTCFNEKDLTIFRKYGKKFLSIYLLFWCSLFMEKSNQKKKRIKRRFCIALLFHTFQHNMILYIPDNIADTLFYSLKDFQLYTSKLVAF